MRKIHDCHAGFKSSILIRTDTENGMKEEYDIVVIGSGPAGQKAAIEASKYGRSVAVIERREVVGGVCLHTGTIPSKTLREAALYFSGNTLKSLYGRNYRVKDSITIEDLRYRTNHVITSELNVIQEHFHRYHIDVLHGQARFIDDHHIEIEGFSETVIIRGEKFILATGTNAYRPAELPFNDTTLIDSDQIMSLSTLPKHLIILGAGVIGIEYASIFSILDVEVTVISRSSQLFGFIDREITDKLSYHLRENKVRLQLQEEIDQITFDDQGKPRVILQSGKRLSADLMLVASGRSGSGHSLLPEKAGLNVSERGLFTVDENFRTELEHIYAVGDVIGFPSLASTSLEQGRRAAQHACTGKMESQFGNFPFGIYSIPEIAYVGLNEEELSAQKTPYVTGVAYYREIAKGEIIEDRTGYMKMLFHQESRKLLGVHILGSEATELIHIAQAVMFFEGGLDYFLNSVFNYPTLAECYKIAAINADRKFRSSRNWNN